MIKIINDKMMYLSVDSTRSDAYYELNKAMEKLT